MDKDKNQELEKILSELNSNIRKQNEPEPSGEAAEPDADSARKKGRKRAPRPEGEPERRRSFAESARIIESSLEDRELRQPAVRHIAVTAAEVVEEEEPPRRRKAYDQQNPPPQEEPVPPMPKRKRRQMSRRDRWTAVMGVIVTLFFVIGVVSTVIAGVRLTRDLVNATSQKEELARVIFPLVIVDIPEFDAPEALENSAIIQSAIWAFIIDENDKSKYPKDDLGAMTVPDTDIEPYIRRLYGNDVQIQHQSIDDPSVQMLYDSDNKRYIIESTPRFLAYTPQVDKISRDGDLYTLQVSYVLPDALWNLSQDHSDATVDKIMEYRLKRNRDSYQMLSVRLLEVTGRSEQGSDLILPDEDDWDMGVDPASEPESALPDPPPGYGADSASGTSSDEDSSSGEDASSGDAAGSSDSSSGEENSSSEE